MTAMDALIAANSRAVDSKINAVSTSGLQPTISGGTKTLLEAESVCNLPIMGTSGVTYSDWKEKFENAVVSFKPSFAAILKFALKNKNERAILEDFREFAEEEGINGNVDELWTTANAELWSVLIDKTEGTAKSKVKDAEVGLKEAIKPGVDSFRKLHGWYTLVGGQSLSALRTRLIAPKAVPDGQVLQALAI